MSKPKQAQKLKKTLAKRKPGIQQKNSFRENVFGVVRKIKTGQTLTYKEVARMAGNERAARAVGAILHTNYDPAIPCHRIIKSSGALGGYNRGLSKKRQMLLSEGAIYE